MFRSINATDVERRRAFPGDDLIANPIDVLTHAITIQRPRHEVWPWLVQMGAGRAGWYSYDLLDNGRRRSAARIIPELQEIHVGGIMPALPGVTDGFTVLRVEPDRWLVLAWLPEKGPPMMTWSFTLEEPKPGITRLVVRARGGNDYRPPFGLPAWTVKRIVPWMHFVMERKQLLGIARRAERSH